MVVALGPGKFYGGSLPRPRIYTYIKFSDERVDPPVSVLDPLLSWAEEAHWSMGGLSFKRLRLQGRIEGNVQRLKKEKEKILKKQQKNESSSSTPIFQSKKKPSVSLRNRGGKRGDPLDSPPPAPISKKRNLRSMLVDEEERENGGVRRRRRRLVRKLGDDFELVASSNGENNGGVSEGVALRTRSRRSMVLPAEEEEEFDNGGEFEVKKIGSVSPKGMNKKNGDKKGSVSPTSGTVTRSSPRLKQKSS